MFSKQFLSTLCLVGAALIWGTAFVAQTTGMEYVGPLTFTNIRFIIGGLLVLPFAFKEFSRLQKVKEKEFQGHAFDQALASFEILARETLFGLPFL